MEQVTREKLQEWRACEDGYNYWVENCEGLSNIDQIRKLMEEHLEWANWLIARIMSREQQLKYAIFAAELVLPIFEKKYPSDNRPRNAIDAAKKVLENDTENNRKAAYAAANAAAYDVYAAAAAYAAYAAAAAYDAYAAAAAYAAYADNAIYVRKETFTKIINYGLELIKE